MIALTGYNVIHYLANRRLISYEQFNENWTFVEDRFRATRNTNVIAQNGVKTVGYFLKQPKSFQYPDDPLQHEEDVLRLIKMTSVKNLVPDFIFKDQGENDVDEKIKEEKRVKYDADNHVLIIKYEFGSLSYLDYLIQNTARNIRSNRISISRKLGKTLYKLSQPLERDNLDIPTKKVPDLKPYISKIKDFKPWILRIDRREVKRFETSRIIFVERLGTLLSNYWDFFCRFSKSWDAKSDDFYLINGDPKFSNVIVKPDKTLLFVDWELAGYAPRLWNLAGMVASYLSFLGYENPPLSEWEIWQSVTELFNGYFGPGVEDERYLTIRYAGIILLQEYYDWASSEFPSGDSVNPDKFFIGKACLLYPTVVWKNKVIPGLKDL